MFIRRIGSRFSSEIPEDGFYLVDLHHCYKLTGPLITDIYNAFMQGQTAFIKYLKGIKTVAAKHNCSTYYTTRLGNCISKINTPGYYEDISNFNWFISTVTKTQFVGIEPVDVQVYYPTGYKCATGEMLYEHDLVEDAGGNIWQIELTPSWDLLLTEVNTGRIDYLTSYNASSLIRKESKYNE